MIILPLIFSMKLLMVSSRKKMHELGKILPEGVLLLNPQKLKSCEEIELAYLLSKDSFRNKKNIAKKFRYEFLLWLSGKTDIKSALNSFSPKKSDKILLIIFKGDTKKILKEMEASEKPLKLKKTAEPLDLERISLSRIKN